MATKFCTLVPHICWSSVWDLLHVTLLMHRILRWLLHFRKFVHLWHSHQTELFLNTLYPPPVCCLSQRCNVGGCILGDFVIYREYCNLVCCDIIVLVTLTVVNLQVMGTIDTCEGRNIRLTSAL